MLAKRTPKSFLPPIARIQQKSARTLPFPLLFKPKPHHHSLCQFQQENIKNYCIFHLKKTRARETTMDVSLRNMGLDPAIVDVLMHDLLEESTDKSQAAHAPSRAFLREARAVAATPADVKELPNSYVFVIDMPGLKKDQIKVYVEEGNTLVVSGERKRERERDQGVKYIKMERRLGKYLKKFVLPENANTEKISATYQDGVLTVTVEKKAPPEPKQPKAIEVQVA